MITTRVHVQGISRGVFPGNKVSKMRYQIITEVIFSHDEENYGGIS